MNKHILVVDDDPIYLKLIANKLRAKDYEINEASNGREALHQLENNTFDLIISDVSLPDISGITLKAKIHEIQNDVPVILISAYPIHEMVVKDANLEIDHNFFLKPVDFDLLLDKVHLKTL